MKIKIEDIEIRHMHLDMLTALCSRFPNKTLEEIIVYAIEQLYDSKRREEHTEETNKEVKE